MRAFLRGQLAGYTALLGMGDQFLGGLPRMAYHRCVVNPPALTYLPSGDQFTLTVLAWCRETEDLSAGDGVPHLNCAFAVPRYNSLTIRRPRNVPDLCGVTGEREDTASPVAMSQICTAPFS